MNCISYEPYKLLHAHVLLVHIPSPPYRRTEIKKVLSVSFALVCFNYSYCSYDQLLGVGFRTLAQARGTDTLLLEFLLYSVKSSTVQQLNKLSQVFYTSIRTLLVNIFGLQVFRFWRIKSLCRTSNPNIRTGFVGANKALDILRNQKSKITNRNYVFGPNQGQETNPNKNTINKTQTGTTLFMLFIANIQNILINLVKVYRFKARNLNITR